MTVSAQSGLEAILAILNNLNGIAGANGTVPLNGTAQNNDLLVGTVENNIMRGNQGNDLLLGFDGEDQLFGDAGNDVLLGGNGNDRLRGGVGEDHLFGDAGNDLLISDGGIDHLTGGAGQDQFAFTGDVFADGVPAPAGQTGINVLNQPDVISDFTIAEDQFAFNKLDLNLDKLVFQQGQSAQLAGDANMIVLTDPFPAAGAAARAIANNDNITSNAGVFVYFNTTLGMTRMAYSQDLANGGDVSLLANLDNQRGETGLANLASFTANNFTLV